LLAWWMPKAAILADLFVPVWDAVWWFRQASVSRR